VTDREGHTLTDPKDELVAALRALVAAVTSCQGWGDQSHGGWTRLDNARERVRLAEAAVAALPPMRAVRVAVRNADTHTGYAEIEGDFDHLPAGPATLLVPVRP
jgi:hypothetical protein